MFEVKLADNLANRETLALSRQHCRIQSSANKKSWLSFATNDYLGLMNHPKVIAAAQKGLQQYGVGSGSAYLISGYRNAHRELEEQLASFLGYPKVLVFSCGYMANLGVIPTLFNKKDFIIADKLNHASLIDSCIAAKAKFKRFPHRDLTTLSKLISTDICENKVVVTEGVFGMDGTIAPLNEIAKLTKQSNSLLFVDDAHGIGVLGKQGQGSKELYNLDASQITILSGTFGKAFGTYGAFVASTEPIIETLKQLCRTYIYTTAIPPAIAQATLTSLEIIRQESWRRDKLFSLINYFKKCAEQLNLPTMNSMTPIQPIMLGSNQKSLDVENYLLNKGILAKAIRPPTVPHSSARIRISLTANHTQNQIDYLLENISHAIKNT